MVTALLTEEASKLTLGQPLEVQTPHQVQTVLKAKGHHWPTGRRLTKYQALLLDSPDLTLKACLMLNSCHSDLQGNSRRPGEYLLLSRQLNVFFFSSQSDLNDQALENSGEEWFMD